MSLAALRNAIRESSGPVTGIELANRLGIHPRRVAAMLDALRASGQLDIEHRSAPPTAECSSASACSLACPGPNECALVVDLNVTSLEIRSTASASRRTTT